MPGVKITRLSFTSPRLSDHTPLTTVRDDPLAPVVGEVVNSDKNRARRPEAEGQARGLLAYVSALATWSRKRE